ncbi:hypothetical protein AB1K54_16025 [Microbacterium sp. BWT-B31]
MPDPRAETPLEAAIRSGGSHDASPDAVLRVFADRSYRPLGRD